MGMGTSVATFGNRGNCVVVRHREYIGDVSSTIAFTNTTYSINPALSTTFPWLSTIAQNFEEYDFKQLVFQFKSTSADALNSTNTALGTVVGATIYNSVNPAFTSKQQMENYEFAKSCKPSEDQVFPVECAHGENPVEQLYTRDTAVPVGADPRLYDLGTFQLATVGSQAAAVIGELWVSYTVELYKPKLDTPGSQIFSSHYRLNADDVGSPSNYFMNAVPLLPQEGSTLDLTIGTNTLTWPSTISAGNYLIIYSLDGIGTVQTVSPTIAATSNCSTIAMFHNGTTARTAYTTGSGGNQTDRLAICVAIKITGPGAVVTMSGGTFVDDPTGGDLIVTQINNNVLTAKQKLAKLSRVIHSEDGKTDPAEEARYHEAVKQAIREIHDEAEEEEEEHSRHPRYHRTGDMEDVGHDEVEQERKEYLAYKKFLRMQDIHKPEGLPLLQPWMKEQQAGETDRQYSDRMLNSLYGNRDDVPYRAVQKSRDKESKDSKEDPPMDDNMKAMFVKFLKGTKQDKDEDYDMVETVPTTSSSSSSKTPRSQSQPKEKS